MMSSADLQLFLAALRSESLAAAASSLGVDRTTVGRRLDELEERLRAPLFVRTRGGLRPTEAALRLRPPAERILGDLRALETTALAADEAVRGTVRIASTEGLAGFFVRHGLLALTARYPELSLEIVSGNRVVELARGEAELAIRTILVREDGVRVRKLRGMVVGLYASPEYLRRRGTPASLEALAGHDLLVPGGELAKLPEARVLAAIAGARVVLRTSSMPTLVEAAVAGHGLVPVVDCWAAVAGLVRVLPLPRIAPRPLWLAVGPGQRERPAVRVVADELARIGSDGS
jgi:DNA-binding transcriptional LysR family regulator